MKGLPVSWRKSRRCVEGTNCVEMAPIRGEVAVRDSKSADSVVVTYAPDQWRAFVSAVRSTK